MAFNLFQHEDALILGMLFWQTFVGKLKLDRQCNKKTYSRGKLKTLIVDNSGRGGWYKDYNGAYGKPGPSVTDQGYYLPGEGGTNTRGGYGLHHGVLQLGGNGGAEGSAGGGAGMYGGGSSFVSAGAGGGSSGCPAAYNRQYGDDSSVYSERFNSELYDVENEPSQLHHFDNGYVEGQSDPYSPVYNKEHVYQYNSTIRHIDPFKKGYDSETIEEELDILLTLNCSSSLYYINEYYNKRDYWSFSEYCNMFSEAAGNGFIMMSKKNERIHFKKFQSDFIEGIVNKAIAEGWPIVGKAAHWVKYKYLKYGKIEGFDRLFLPRDGWTQEFTLEPGTYEFILFGAQGGSRGNWSPNTDAYIGGLGGCQVCVVDIPKDAEPLTLYAVLGERGKSQANVRAFNGGGSCSPGCTGGGGSTDIRWSPLDQGNTVRSRIAVAGGGGGIDGSGSGGGDGDDSYSDVYPGIPSDQEEMSSDVYYVNDQSIVRVTFTGVVSYDDIESPVIDLTIEIDEGQEGTMTKEVTIESTGALSVDFYLDEIYPPDTPTHQVTIRVSFKKKNKVFLGFTRGFEVFVLTRFKDNESSDVPRNPILLTCSDRLTLKDAVSFVLNKLENLDLEAGDTVKLSDNSSNSTDSIQGGFLEALDILGLKDNVELKVDTSGVMSMSASDYLKLKDSAELIVNKINVIELEASDLLGVTDETETDKAWYVNIDIDPNNPSGSVFGEGYYINNSEVTLEAIPGPNCSVEWYLGDDLISTESLLNITVTGDVNYVVKFISENTGLPYILDGLTDAFDALYNKGLNKPMDKKATVWQNCMEADPSFSTDGHGIVDDSRTDAFDGIQNTVSGHNSEATEWENIN